MGIINRVKKWLRSPTRFIEATGNPELEMAYLKFPRRKIVPIKGDRTPTSFYSSPKHIQKILESSKGVNPIHIHTHPLLDKYLSAYPSFPDFWQFMKEGQKTRAIAVREPKSGKVVGYSFLRKTKKTPKFSETIDDLYKDLSLYDTILEEAEFDWDSEKELKRDVLTFMGAPPNRDISSINVNEAYSALCRDMNVQYRFVPAKGYYFDKTLGTFKRKSSLESAVTTSIFIGVFLAIAFLFLNNVTGFAISSDVTKAKTNLTLGVLFILTIVGLFINSVNRKKIL